MNKPYSFATKNFFKFQPIKLKRGLHVKKGRFILVHIWSLILRETKTWTGRELVHDAMTTTNFRNLA